MIFPKIMGILNATPDSFSDGNGTVNQEYLYQKAVELIKYGADIIDIGGESTRPGAETVPTNIEIDRILPITKRLRNEFPEIPISIDTRKAEVAEAVLNLGVQYINDVSGLRYESEIAELVGKKNKTMIIMHSKNSPKTMQDTPYYNNILQEVFDFLSNRIEFARNKGIKDIIVDVGIGFAKNYEHNIELLKNLSYFDKLDVPQLLGISRKRFVGETTYIEKPEERDAATMFLHALLLKNKNVGIIRVHNIRLAIQLKQVCCLLQ